MIDCLLVEDFVQMWQCGSQIFIHEVPGLQNPGTFYTSNLFSTLYLTFIMEWVTGIQQMFVDVDFHPFNKKGLV